MFGVVRTAFPQLRTMTCAENLPLHDAAALKALNVTDIVVFAQCGGRPLVWTVAEPTQCLWVPLAGFLASRRRDQRRNGEKRAKNGR